MMAQRGFNAPDKSQILLYATLGERGYYSHMDDILDEILCMYYFTQIGTISEFMHDTGTEYLHQRNADLAALIETNPDQEPERLAFLSHLTDEEMLELCWSHYDKIPHK